MSSKKGFFSNLFGGKSSSGCCNMEIVEEPKKEKSSGCCDMQIVPESGTDSSTKEQECYCVETDGNGKN